MSRRPDYLKPKDAAAVAGITVEQLRWRARKGDIACSQMPGSGKGLRLFRRTDCEAIRRQIEDGFRASEEGQQEAAERKRQRRRPQSSG